MRAHHGVDAVARPARLAKTLQERRGQRQASGALARRIVADAGVDDQLQLRRIDQQRVNAELQDSIVLVDEVRIELRRLAQLRGRGLRYDRGRHRQILSTMRVIFTRLAWQVSIVLTPPRSTFDPTEV